MIKYRYTSFFNSRVSLWIQLITSGNSIDTSVPIVIAAITHFIASVTSDAFKLWSCFFHSPTSPFFEELKNRLSFPRTLRITFPITSFVKLIPSFARLRIAFTSAMVFL